MINPQKIIKNFVSLEIETLAKNIEEVIQDISSNISQNNVDQVYHVDYIAQVQKLKRQKLGKGY